MRKSSGWSSLTGEETGEEEAMAKTPQRRPPEYARKHDRILHRAATAREIECDLIVAPLQRQIELADAKYGYDVLPLLVMPETAAKWARATAGLHEAVGEQDVEKVKAWVQVCLRGLIAMQEEAKSNPDNLLPPQIWDCEVDGETFCVIRDARQHERASRLRPGRRVYTMREVAVALRAMQTHLVDTVKDTFAGAEIVGVRKIEDDNVEDDLDKIFEA